MWHRPQGYAEIITPEEDVASLDRLRKEKIAAGTNKYDTATCHHCNSIFHVSAGMRPEDIGGMCPTCWKIICPRCLDKPCRGSWEDQMDILEAIARDEAVRGYF